MFILNPYLSEKENKQNKVTSLNSTSTDEQYPSAKATYTELSSKQPSVFEFHWIKVPYEFKEVLPAEVSIDQLQEYYDKNIEVIGITETGLKYKLTYCKQEVLVFALMTNAEGNPYITTLSNEETDYPTIFKSYDNVVETPKWGSITGNLQLQADLNEALESKQDQLISGTTLKTVNSQSLLGSGDVGIKTYAPFPSDFVTYGSLQQVVNSMTRSSGAIQGMAYLGGISGSCTPFGYGNVECKVEFMLNGLAVLTVNSSNIYPYSWYYNSASGDYTWKTFTNVDANLTQEQLDEIAQKRGVTIADGGQLTEILIDNTTYSVGSGEAENNAYTTIKQLNDYLFETQYTTENVDYDYANEYFQNTTESIGGGGCSGVISNGRVLRQLDWLYDNNVEFIVRKVADPEAGLYGSFAVCSGFKNLTKEIVESGAYSEKYKIVPFIVTDGMNDQGLYIQSNVVPKFYEDDSRVNYNLNPESTDKCCVTMVIRYILDHCADFNDIEDFFNTYNIYSPAPEVLDFGCHYLVAKGNQYGIIELTNDGFTLLRESDLKFPVMTNFRLNDEIVDTDGNVDWNKIEKYGIGVERFETALTAFSGTSLETLRSQLAYTNWYTGDGYIWPTEFCGSDYEGEKITAQGVKEGRYDLTSMYIQERSNYGERTREDGKGTWQTVHSSIYDLTTGNLNLAIQERMDEAFNVNFDGSDANCITDVKVDGSSVVNNGVANIQKELYYCTYGTTTFNEVQEALNNNKLPICEYLNKTYLYSYTSTHHFFINMSQTDKTVAQSRIQCKTDGWSSGGTIYSENKANKVTTLSSSSTDAQYPSAKAVYDSLGAKANLVDGKVPASELPSYVDDVLEFDSAAVFPVTGEQGKVYVAKDTNFTYRWSGTAYIRLNDVDLTNYYTKIETNGLLETKQNTLVSGTNIKTINSQSVLGEGDLEIQTAKLFKITFEQNDEVVTSDKSANQIYTAVTNGDIIETYFIYAGTPLKFSMTFETVEMEGQTYICCIGFISEPILDWPAIRGHVIEAQGLIDSSSPITGAYKKIITREGKLCEIANSAIESLYKPTKLHELTADEISMTYQGKIILKYHLGYESREITEFHFYFFDGNQIQHYMVNSSKVISKIESVSPGIFKIKLKTTASHYISTDKTAKEIYEALQKGYKIESYSDESDLVYGGIEYKNVNYYVIGSGEETMVVCFGYHVASSTAENIQYDSFAMYDSINSENVLTTKMEQLSLGRTLEIYNYFSTFENPESLYTPSQLHELEVKGSSFTYDGKFVLYREFKSESAYQINFLDGEYYNVFTIDKNKKVSRLQHEFIRRTDLEYEFSTHNSSSTAHSSLFSNKANLVHTHSAEALNYSSTAQYEDGTVGKAISGKQDKLTAGTNITIENNVISASGGSGGVIVHLTEDGEGNISCDTSIATIKGYYDAEKLVYCQDANGIRLPLVMATSTVVSFAVGGADGSHDDVMNGLSYIGVVSGESDTWFFTEATLDGKMTEIYNSSTLKSKYTPSELKDMMESHTGMQYNGISILKSEMLNSKFYFYFLDNYNIEKYEVDASKNISRVTQRILVDDNELSGAITSHNTSANAHSTLFNSKANVNHTHNGNDVSYSTSTVYNDGTVGKAISGKADAIHTHDDRYYTESEVDTKLGAKQDTLVSGENIKTVNNQSLLGEGNINVGGSASSVTYDNTTSGLEATNVQSATDELSEKIVNLQSGKQNIPSQVTSGTEITLADNTEYRLTNVSNLTLSYPQGNFECWLRLTTASSGAISINLPNTTKYIGSMPDFDTNETWEISIKDGIAVAVAVSE